MSSPDREWPIVDRSVSMTGCVASHLDALGRARDLQPHVDAHDLPREQFHFANVVLETLNADRQQIAARVEVQDLKASSRRR